MADRSAFDDAMLSQMNDLRSAVHSIQKEVLPQIGEIRGAFTAWNKDHREYRNDFAEAMRQFITIRQELGLIRDAATKTAIDLEVLVQKVRNHDSDISDLKANDKKLTLLLEKFNERLETVTHGLDVRLDAIERDRAKEKGEQRVFVIIGGAALSAVGFSIGAVITYFVPGIVTTVASWFDRGGGHS